MLKSVLFLGPTLPAAEAVSACPALEVRAPAGCGDIYRAVRDGAAVVAIVDGYFDHQLSVWHKEILWALSKGVRVYGAASMGALRAAELAPFGMLGLGKVFEAFQSGQLECDDEVAVAHESAERGYAPVSEALVNVRATVAVAIAEGAIDQEEGRQLVAAGSSVFYPQRTFPAIVKRAREDGLSDHSAVRFQRWLGPDGARRVDQKRADARALLEELQSPQVSVVVDSFHFEYTEVWHELVRKLDSQPAARAPEATAPAPRSGVVRRHAPPANASLWSQALERALSLALSSHAAAEVDEAAVQTAADAFRRRHGLLTPETTQRWLNERGIDLATFSARMLDDVVVARLAQQARSLAESELEWLLVGQTEPAAKSAEIL